MTDNKPTLHHFDHSQYQRILWLLEELGVEYNVIYHFRKPVDDPIVPFRSPESLKALGPYGKAPVLTTGTANGNRYTPESDAICTYLLRNFDTEDRNGKVEWLDGPELRELLTILDEELKNAPEGGYFMGKNPGRADIMMKFPMSFVKHRNRVDLEKEFPRLDEWLKRIYDRPAWKRGSQKGNGSYDLNVFPKRAVT
ncbi:uncharacterized protein EAF01_001512 [Botrytis porri]|uniref:GST N-terminal domain-containing protein n=1 Tax=Botrytis porri TaxID=87229 RepID=A0A4Z1KIZ0_9HELO|nr:uncharacterized protein EAF01_001512 [Botrytis porri]KAF7912491.1 hypothetical protein EAF01_001512 [Botrytis porri]TGO86031.1 hypothetical protein BPOR_0341g00020 [Botrytis porri]